MAVWEGWRGLETSELRAGGAFLVESACSSAVRTRRQQPPPVVSVYWIPFSTRTLQSPSLSPSLLSRLVLAQQSNCTPKSSQQPRAFSADLPLGSQPSFFLFTLRPDIGVPPHSPRPPSTPQHSFLNPKAAAPATNCKCPSKARLRSPTLLAVYLYLASGPRRGASQLGGLADRI